jgi:hypothetical protein
MNHSRVAGAAELSAAGLLGSGVCTDGGAGAGRGRWVRGSEGAGVAAAGAGSGEAEAGLRNKSGPRRLTSETVWPAGPIAGTAVVPTEMRSASGLPVVSTGATALAGTS